MHWAQAIIHELRLVDAEEAPHGLYGLRNTRRTGTRLPRLSSILIEPPIRFLRRIQVTQRGNGIRSDSLNFGVEGSRNVIIDIHTYADTKVREFGDTFRLDKRSLPADREAPDLGKVLRRMSEKASGDYGRLTYSFGYLFIGHFAKEKDMISTLHFVTSAEFRELHAIQHKGDAWRDVHARAFWSSAHLWYIEQPTKNFDADLQSENE